MPRVFLGLGSNKGDRLRFLQEAFARLAAVHGVGAKAWSAIYETSPYGFRDQGDFLNAVIEVLTDLDPATLHAEIRMVESLVGRTPSIRWGPREIDIDLLLYGSEIIETRSLVIPHRGLAGRRFVLEPLAEIAPDVVDPRTGKAVRVLLEECPDRGTVTRTSWKLTTHEQVYDSEGEHTLARRK